MTYCLAIKVDEGLVFGSDTRTSAAVDDVRTYNKSHTFAFPGERVFVMLSAGNLATTQALLQRLNYDIESGAPVNLRNARSAFAAAEYLGAASVATTRASAQLSQSTADFRVSLILGGQIAGHEPEIYMVYPEGNCMPSSPETPFLQIGEVKYGLTHPRPRHPPATRPARRRPLRHGLARRHHQEQHLGWPAPGPRLPPPRHPENHPPAPGSGYAVLPGSQGGVEPAADGGAERVAAVSVGAGGGGGEELTLFILTFSRV